ncbi:MAG: PAS domain S-box protein [Planctomycetota bacterium]|nr:PAS domain S-box protein [Planctomycetota bacterium]
MLWQPLRNQGRRYLFAALAVLIAVLIRELIVQNLGNFGRTQDYLIYCVEVIVVALVAGVAPAIFASFLSAVAAAFWVLPPEGVFVFYNIASVLGLVSFFAVGCILSLIIGHYGLIRQRAAASQRALLFRQSEDRFRQQAEEQRAQAAAQIQREKDLLAVTLASIGDGVIVTDADGQITFINREGERLTGLASTQTCGQPLGRVLKIFDLQTQLPQEDPVAQVLRDGAMKASADRFMLVSSDGKEIPIDEIGAPLRRADGTVEGVVLVIRDFSEQKKSRDALLESEERFRILVDQASDALIINDMEGNIVDVNRKACETLGYSRRELLGMSLQGIKPAFDLTTAKKGWATLSPGSALTVQSSLRRKNGSCFEVETSLSCCYIRGQPLFLGMVRDVTERKAAETQLRLQATVLQSAANAIVISGPDGVIQWVNPAFTHLTGYRAGEAIGKTLRLLKSDEHDSAFYAEMWQTVLSGKPWRGEIVNRRKDGSLYTEEMTITPVRDEAKEITHFVSIKQDISERKAAAQALSAAKESAEQANKAKDHFLAVLSHELRTPLAPVLVSVSMLRKQPGLDADTRESLEVIHRNIELEARLIDDLLDVTRIEHGKLELDLRPVELATILRWAVEVCMPDIEARRLHFNIDALDGPYSVSADSARLQQVLWNLLKNAIKFTPPGGNITLRTRCDGDDHVIVQVIDSGEGIDMDLLPRLFSAFEQGGRRTTQQFGGLGLGLAISRALVEMHGGTLTGESKGKGQGATFTMRLRALSSGVTKPAAEMPRRPIWEAFRKPKPLYLRILLVEDHGDTARIMRRLLQDQGHTVETAGDVATALNVVGDGDGFDLLLSDLGLPDGSGLDIMRALRAKGCKLPGIAVSGYGQEQDMANSRQAGFIHHLVKPVSIDRLNESISSIISPTEAVPVE